MERKESYNFLSGIKYEVSEFSLVQVFAEPG